MSKMSCAVFLSCVVFTMTLLDANDAITLSMKEFKGPVTKCFDQTLPSPGYRVYLVSVVTIVSCLFSACLHLCIVSI